MLSHDTSIKRPTSSCVSAEPDILGQSRRCMETPLPRVINPIISSPGTGVQQRDKRTKQLSMPCTIIPLLPARVILRSSKSISAGRLSSIFFGDAFASLTYSSLSLITTFWAVRPPYPIEAYKSSSVAKV